MQARLNASNASLNFRILNFPAMSLSSATQGTPKFARRSREAGSQDKPSLCGPLHCYRLCDWHPKAHTLPIIPFPVKPIPAPR